MTLRLLIRKNIQKLRKHHDIPCLLLSILMLSSCYKLRNDLNSIALECDIHPSLSHSRFIEIKNSEDEGFDGIAPTTLQATFVNASGTSSDLSVSSKGCVSLPDENGTLFVIDRFHNQSTVKSIDTGLTSFSKIRLIEQPSVEANMPCPDQGLFANKELTSNWFFSGKGDLQSLRFLIQATNEKDSSKHILFEKGFGLSELNMPKNLSTELLKEGTYQLEATVYDLLQGMGSEPKVLNSQRACPLTILHRVPLTGGFQFTSPNVPVFQPGDSLPWNEPQQNEVLYSCHEDVSESPVTQSTECHPQNKCRSFAEFSPDSKITSTIPGIFNFYVFNRDKAKNQSELSCQTVIFSDSNPKINLKWSKESWNRPNAVMELPYLELKAEVSLSHPLIEQKLLEKSLLCKVEFVLQGKDILSGKDVKCTSGRCEGKDLSQFEPCDAHISFTIKDAMAQKAIQNSMMFLRVKANDGAGHEEETSRSLRLSTSSWGIDYLEMTIEGKKIPVKDLRSSAQSNILALFANNDIRIWRNHEWQNITPSLPGLVEDSSNIHMFRTLDRDIYVKWLTKIDGKIATRITKWIDETSSWKIFEFASDCTIIMNHQKGFWCYSSTSDNVDHFNHFNGESFEGDLTEPAGKGPCKVSSEYNYSLSGNALWLTCIGGEFVYTDKWQEIEIASVHQTLPQKSQAVFQDGKGRIWMYGFAFKDTNPHSLKRLDLNQHYDDIPLPPMEDSASSPYSSIMIVDRSGQLCLGAFCWNDEASTWLSKPEFNSDASFRDSLYQVLETNSDSDSWRGNKTIITKENGDLVAWNDSLFDSSAISLREAYRDVDGSLWSIGWRDNEPVVVHVRQNRLTKFTRQDSGMPIDANFPSIEADKIKTYSKTKGLFKLQDGLWEIIAKAPIQPSNQDHPITYSMPNGAEFLGLYDTAWYKEKSSSEYKLLYKNDNHRDFMPTSPVYIDGELFFAIQLDGTIKSYKDGITSELNIGLKGDQNIDLRNIDNHLIAVTGGLYYRLDTDSNGIRSFKPIDPTSLWNNGPQVFTGKPDLIFKNNDLFVLKNEDNLLVSSPNSKNLRVLPIPPSLRTITMTKMKKILAYTDEGLFLEDSNGWKTLFSKEQLLKISNEFSRFIEELAVDDNDRLWIKFTDDLDMYWFDLTIPAN